MIKVSGTWHKVQGEKKSRKGRRGKKSLNKHWRNIGGLEKKQGKNWRKKATVFFLRMQRCNAATWNQIIDIAAFWCRYWHHWFTASCSPVDGNTSSIWAAIKLIHIAFVFQAKSTKWTKIQCKQKNIFNFPEVDEKKTGKKSKKKKDYLLLVFLFLLLHLPYLCFHFSHFFPPFYIFNSIFYSIAPHLQSAFIDDNYICRNINA